ncbi:archaetidylserine decarboxylase [Marinobacter sp. ELB17]|uniref:archaetidylserine decarboxylase n=1 Tax=Marinobacter sp. ELB17 TaxID=270374 RepID=UPI0000F369C7|nr:archaetidylserine decarboxylase [Marinobacter sp. ELB17]EAZ99278.1 phosphatidylserine decarboxylase [Marinobacter sp. ELB17]
MMEKLFVLSQYIAPQLSLSRLAGRMANSTGTPALRHRFIRWFINRYGVNMSEAENSDPDAYDSFNDFFTRALKPGLRPIEGNESTLVSPVDGCVSQLGNINGGRIFQAKGQSFSLLELLGGDQQRADIFAEGEFATIYLAPGDYHRIHMPMAGQLREMVHVPGRLFSVNPATAAIIPNLFARNERVVCMFDTATGPMALVLVGAMIVGSVETPWAGVVKPGAAPGDGGVSQQSYSGEQALKFARGEEMGRFRLGSTVVMVMPKGRTQWSNAQKPGKKVKLGEIFGEVEA